MQPVNHVLFPVDFSERALAIAPAVAAYVRQFNAKLTLVHAREWPWEGAEEDWSGEAAAHLSARLQARLGDFLRDELPQAERVVLKGKPAGAIVQAARERGVDLIMMPTRGETRFRQMLLGSTTAAVLHDAECAVWTEAHAEAMSVPAEVRSIVCALDLEDTCAYVLQAARMLAESWKARLAVVHEVIGVDPRFETAIADRAHSWLVNEAHRRYPAIAQKAGATQALEIVEDLKLGAGLAKAAERHQADLLVIGRGAIHGAVARVWAHTQEIVRVSPCPVLSV
ncbi:MAG: universal stress protein [Bryobacterales bacterium]|nr:universal stress protein [Bryobacterales bacterium]